jgi:hypothetical protein
MFQRNTSWMARLLKYWVRGELGRASPSAPASLAKLCDVLMVATPVQATDSRSRAAIAPFGSQVCIIR